MFIREIVLPLFGLMATLGGGGKQVREAGMGSEVQGERDGASEEAEGGAKFVEAAAIAGESEGDVGGECKFMKKDEVATKHHILCGRFVRGAQLLDLGGEVGCDGRVEELWLKFLLVVGEMLFERKL